MEPDSTEALFLAWREHADLRALAQVFDEIAPELYAVARHLARGTSDAEDLVQQTFLAALERAAAWDRERALRPWIFGILAHEARKLRARRVPEVEPAGVEQPIEELLREELHGSVAAAVGGLPAHYASAVTLHLEDGLPAREIAARLGITRELARTHLSRGLAALRRAMPEGLSTGAWIGSAGFTNLRESVLAKASVSSAPVAAAVPSLVLWLVLPLLLLGGGFAWKRFASTSSASTRPPLVSELRATPAVEPAQAEKPLETSNTDPSRSVAAPASLPTATASLVARAHGRILLAGGAPAAGTPVVASTYVSAERRTRELGRADCDAQGNFALALDVAAPLYASLRVEHAGFCSASSSLGELHAGSEIDAGELVLPRGATLRATLVDAEARALAEGWEITSSADAPQTRSANKRWVFWSKATVDARDGSAVLAGLPPGELKLAASSPLSFEQISRTVTLVEGQESAAEFRYAGPDLRKRIVLRTRTSWSGIRSFAPASASVKLRVPGESAARAPTQRAPGEFIFDGLGEQECELEIDDPDFERWSEPHAQPGRALSPALRGASSVRLAVADARGAPITSYGLGITFPDARFRPNTFELLPAGSNAPDGGLVGGLFPGTCVLLVRPAGLPERSLRVEKLRRGETRELKLEYANALALTGRIVDAQHAPLGGVALELTQGERAGEETQGTLVVRHGREVSPAGPIAQRATSDADGHFSFGDLEAGTWTVRARFSRWLVADKTLAFAKEAPAAFELARPPAGFLAGTVELPQGVDPAAVELVIGDDFIPRAARAEKRPDIVIAKDGSFRAGPLPTGVQLLRALIPAGASGAREAVGSHESISGSQDLGRVEHFEGRAMRSVSHESISGVQDLGRFEIFEGSDTRRVFDLSGVLPLSIACEVLAGEQPVDEGWLVALHDDAQAQDLRESIALGTGGRATIAVSARRSVQIGVVARELGWVYCPDERFSGASGQTIERKLEVPLVKRTLHCIDAATKAPLAAREVRWRAKLGEFTAEAHAKTDAQGVLELALPEGSYEFSDGARESAAASSITLGPNAGAPVEIALRTRE